MSLKIKYRHWVSKGIVQCRALPEITLSMFETLHLPENLFLLDLEGVCLPVLEGHAPLCRWTLDWAINKIR